MPLTYDKEEKMPKTYEKLGPKDVVYCPLCGEKMGFLAAVDDSPAQYQTSWACASFSTHDITVEIIQFSP